MKAIRWFIAMTMIAAFPFMQSCKKESTTNQNLQSTTAVAADNSKAEAAYDNVKLWSDKAMAGHALKTGNGDTVYMGTCVLATLNLGVNPYLLTIDFGNTNCLCDDGKYRRGKIIVTFTGSYWSQGTVITYSFDNFFVDNDQILGTKTITNMGTDQSGHPWWQVQVSGQIILANNGGNITWNSSYQYEWSEGYGTPFVWWDDVYLISGSANGVSAGGVSYSYSITTPLKKKLNCEWIVSGILEIQPQGAPAAILDYGDGTCDDILNVTYDGQTFVVHMG
jgi:hypothetical protein